MTRSLLSRFVTVAAVVALAAACGGTVDGEDAGTAPTTEAPAENTATPEDDTTDDDASDAPGDQDDDAGQDDSVDAPDEGSDEPTDDDEPVTTEGDCSASGTEPADVVDVAGMPAEVAALRDFLANAALRCDEQLLFTAIEESEQFTYSFGDEGDAIGFWWELEATGDEPYRRIVDVLSTTPAWDVDAGMWVWPAVATGQDGSDAPELLAELEPWTGPAALEDLDGSGYLGWRIGISTDGQWRYFVAGD